MDYNSNMSKIKGFSDTIEWYEANAVCYAKNIQDFPHLDMLEDFVRVVGLGKQVLDIGCAAGRDSKILNDLGLLVTGIDLSKSLLEIARAKFPKINFVQANFLNLPFVKESFDGVWAHASLLHLEEFSQVEQAIQEFNRILRKGGVLHVYVKQQVGEEKTSVVGDSLSNHERFFRWFTGDEVKKLLIENNFTILQLHDNLPDSSNRAEVKWIHALAKRAF